MTGTEVSCSCGHHLADRLAVQLTPIRAAAEQVRSRDLQHAPWVETSQGRGRMRAAWLRFDDFAAVMQTQIDALLAGGSGGPLTPFPQLLNDRVVIHGVASRGTHEHADADFWAIHEGHLTRSVWVPLGAGPQLRFACPECHVRSVARLDRYQALAFDGAVRHGAVLSAGAVLPVATYVTHWISPRATADLVSRRSKRQRDRMVAAGVTHGEEVAGRAFPVFTEEGGVARMKALELLGMTAS